MADLINETLEIFEQNGGEDAYINIKSPPPGSCWESSVEGIETVSAQQHSSNPQN